MKKEKNFEREFLIRLAPIYLLCRWLVINEHGTLMTFKYRLMGVSDYSWEMKLIVEEELQRLSAIQSVFHDVTDL
jgi:hypothetical protein